MRPVHRRSPVVIRARSLEDILQPLMRRKAVAPPGLRCHAVTVRNGEAEGLGLCHVCRGPTICACQLSDFTSGPIIH